MAEHTRAYDEYFKRSFDTCFENYPLTEKFEDERHFSDFCVKYLKKFIEDNGNEYIANLHPLHREAFRDIGFLFEELANKVLTGKNNYNAVGEIVSKLNQKAESFKSSTFRSILMDFPRLLGGKKENETISEQLVNEIIQEILVISISDEHKACLEDLLGEIDTFLARYVSIPKVKKEMKKSLSKDVLYVLQETLGLLARYPKDGEHVSQRRGIENLLSLNGVKVVWPDLSKSTFPSEEFFLWKNTDISEPVVQKPCFRLDDGQVLQGDIFIPCAADGK